MASTREGGRRESEPALAEAAPCCPIKEEEAGWVQAQADLGAWLDLRHTWRASGECPATPGSCYDGRWTDWLHHLDGGGHALRWSGQVHVLGADAEIDGG